MLALAASLLFACAALLQQQGGRTALAVDAAKRTAPPPPRRFPLVHAMTRVVRHPIWLLGWCTNLVGFLIQAAALQAGSVAVVQPVLATQLLFTLLLIYLRRRQVPPPTAWLGGGGICVGLVVLLDVDGAAPLSGDPDRPSILLAALAALGLVILLVSAAARLPRSYTVLAAVAAGVCFAMSAVFLKLTTDDLINRGVGPTAQDWPGYFLAASTLTGLLIEQGAFVAGPLAWSVAAMNVTNPLVSFCVGLLAFQVAVPDTPGELAGIASSGLLLVLGITALAHIPTGEQPQNWAALHASGDNITGQV
ncbi:MAG: DMT family transporter [Nocardioidaceae bacterium]